MKFQIVKVRPQGFLHCDGFDEIISSLGWSLSELGHQVVVAENAFSPDGMNILFGAELLSPEQQLPENTILYNLEQWPDKRLENIRRLAKGRVLWDYNKQNVERWKVWGRDAIHVPFGYTPNLTKIPKAPTQDIDVFHSGFLTERRVKLMDQLRAAGLNVVSVGDCYGGARDQLISRAKVCLNVRHDGRPFFNAQRVSFWLANSKCVVSEISSDDADYSYLDRAIIRVPYEQIVDKCVELVSERRHPQMTSYGDMQQIGFDVFSVYEYTPLVAAALKQLPQPNPILTRYERGCIEGDMKEYLPFLRANARGKMLEIGVRDGASTAAMLLGVEENGGSLHSIDIKDCSKLWTHPRWGFECGDSRNSEFPDNEFDAAFIDGDHSGGGFLADLHNCFRWVKSGGWIACHDTSPPKTFEEYGGDWPSVAVGLEFKKFCAEKGLTNYSLCGVQGMGVLVVKK